MDSFDYVMHGRIFSLEHVGQSNQLVEVQVSFGGLLLKVRGEQAQLSALEADLK
jgi:DNA-directed RNA polymerase I, II, and III subunit RPABC3